MRIARKGDGLDFDDHRAWGPLLTAAVGDLISEPVVEQLVAAAPDYRGRAWPALFLPEPQRNHRGDARLDSFHTNSGLSWFPLDRLRGRLDSSPRPSPLGCPRSWPATPQGTLTPSRMG